MQKIIERDLLKYRGIMIGMGVLTLILTTCITPFEPTGVQETEGILAVEGMILDTGTTIKLSRTISIYNSSEEELYTNMEDAYHAVVHVIDDQNNIIAVAEQKYIDGMPSAEYIVKDTIIFKPNTKYALSIEIGGKKYQSSFVSAVMTPEIDEITWRQNRDKSMDIMISTHDPENKIEYYCWKFEEDWEYRSLQFGTHRYERETNEIIEQSEFTANNRYYCWDSNKSKSIILGTSDKLTEATIKNKVIQSFQASNTRFSYLYSFFVKQYALDKEAYTYFENIRKNIEQSGSIFAPIFSEVKGNITCLSDPNETVIGYIFAAKEVESRIYIDMERIVGEDDYYCYFTYQDPVTQMAYTANEIAGAYVNNLGILFYENGIYHCVRIKCVDCTTRGGTKNKPDFWPTDHL